MRLSSDQSIIYKKHLKIRFSAYYMLPQVPSNEIFLHKIPHDISSFANNPLILPRLFSKDLTQSIWVGRKNRTDLKV